MRAEVRIDVGGRAWIARPTFDAVESIERVVGPIGSVKRRQIQSWVSMTDVARVIYECIRSSNTHPGQTYAGPSYEQIGEAVLAMGLPKAIEPFTTLLDAILGVDRQETEEGKVEAPEAPIQSPSLSDVSSEPL